MQDNKTIADSFSAAHSTYDDEAAVQKICADLLVEKLRRVLPDFMPSTILDIGSGTGNVVAKLLNYFPDSSYILSDIAPLMLEEAKLRFHGNNFAYLLRDMDSGALSHHDLVTSSFALQWSRDWRQVVNSMCRAGRVVAFSCLLQGTLAEWYKKIGVQTNLPSMEDLISWLVSLSDRALHYEYKEYSMEFADALTWLRHLRRLGAHALPPSAKRVCPLGVMHNEPLLTQYKVGFFILG